MLAVVFLPHRPDALDVLGATALTIGAVDRDVDACALGVILQQVGRLARGQHLSERTPLLRVIKRLEGQRRGAVGLKDMQKSPRLLDG